MKNIVFFIIEKISKKKVNNAIIVYSFLEKTNYKNGLKPIINL